MHATFVGYSLNIQGMFIQYSQNIIWEYSAEFHRELFPNILGIYHGNVPQIFPKHIFARWESSINNSITKDNIYLQCIFVKIHKV